MLNSLRLQLLTWVLLPACGVTFISSWLSYENSIDTATEVQDQLLLGSARSIAEQIRFEDGSFQNQIPPAALELFQSTQPDHIYYKITAGDGHLLAGHSDLPGPSRIPGEAMSTFFDAVMRQEPVRVGVVLQPVIGDPNALPVVVEVAQTRHSYQQMVHRLWLQGALQQLGILGVAAVLVVLGIRMGLRPVMHLHDALLARQPGTLKPIDADQVPTELRPLVTSLNDYISRLEQHLQRQQDFLQNAAHQLRTPLAILHTQLGVASQASQPEDVLEGVRAARKTAVNATRLTNQLLSFSQLEHTTDCDANASADVKTVATKVLEELALHADRKLIGLAYDGPSFPVRISGISELMLHELLINLVDNAIRYTSSGGKVIVRLVQTDEAHLLEIEDNGPGISPELRELVFERFYRIRNDYSDGSGLGLSIVRRIAHNALAQVSIETPASGSGTLVRVAFHLGP